MSRKLPPAYDLTAFIRAMEREDRTKRIGKALIHYLDVASAHADLLFASQLLYSIIEEAQARAAVSRYGMAIRGALLSQSILLYARATLVTSARKTFDVTSRFTPAQKAVHKRIDGWRNGAIAHFDRDTRHEEALWADERLIAVPGERPSLRPVVKRLVVRDELVKELLPQVETALAIYADLMREKHKVAENVYRAALDAWPTLRALVDANPFDAPAFFESWETAADFLGEGRHSATIHELIGN